MIGTWWGILAVALMLSLMFGGLKLLERLVHPHPELLRKLLHVGMGLVVISFPWLFTSTWPVLLLAGISAVALGAVKLVPRLRDGIGSVVTGVHRTSLGEVCFPAAVAALFLMSRSAAVSSPHVRNLLFVVPMLIMTLADTVAALVGIAYGKVRYVTSDGFKSAEGSIAFFSIAFLSVHVPLLLFTMIDRPQTLLIAVIIGILSTIIEAIAAQGLDNLFIPLGAFGFLKLYMHASVDALLLRLAATVLLLGFALSWRRRTSLDDSALMAAALFGYGAWMLGGPIWLIGPAVLFVIHLYFWPRFGPYRDHSVYAVVSVTLAGVLWLALNVASGGQGRYLFPYAVGFGAHLAIIGVSRIAHDPSSHRPFTRLMLSIVAGWVLTFIQMLPLLIQSWHALAPIDLLIMMLAGFCCVGIGAVGFYPLLGYLYGPRGSNAAIHVAGFITAFAGSLAAVAFQCFFESKYAGAHLFPLSPYFNNA